MIETLKEALAVSPDNIPLRLSLADLLRQEKQWKDAADQYKEVLNRDYGNLKAKTALAACYFAQGLYSAAIIIYEEIESTLPPGDRLLYIKALVKENNFQDAAAMYQMVLALHPDFADSELDAALRLPAGGGNEDNGFAEWDDEEDDIFLEKPDINFSHVGGMDKVKQEISMKIIKPLQHPELFAAYGKKAGGGVLLYGPPGCGKTYIARATAGEINARFINVGLHEILDMWVGNSEKNLHEVFAIARQNKPCVLFIDEVDALGASRNDLKQSGIRHTINQFLSEMDGIANSNEGVLILAATNAPWSLDSAFRRPGRFDRVLFVPPPDEKSRVAILKSYLTEKIHEGIDCEKIAAATPEYSGADLKALIDLATEAKLEEALTKGAMVPITTKDLLQAAKKHDATTREWFATAKNYALYSNTGGQYNEILEYINRKNK